MFESIQRNGFPLRMLLLVLLAVTTQMFVVVQEIEAVSKCDKYFEHGRKLQKAKKYKESEMFFTQSLKRCKNDARFYYYRAELRGEYLGRKVEALNDYSAAIRINPRFYSKAFWRRGRIYYQLGMYNQSIQDYNSCLKLNPKYTRVYYMRGLSYGKIGEIEKAVKDIKYTIKLDPKYRIQGEPILRKIISGRTDY